MKSRRIIGVVFGIAILGIVFLMLRDKPVRNESQSPAPETREPIVAAAHAEMEDTGNPIAPTSEATAQPDPQLVDTAAPRTGTGIIFGKVRFPDDAPKGLPVTVSLHFADPEGPADQSTELHSVNVGEDGSFEFDRLPRALYVLYADAEGYTATAIKSLLLYDRNSQEAWLHMEPSAPISGRVLTPAREPVAGAHVFLAASHLDGWLRPGTRESALSSRQTTDADGRFNMLRLRQVRNDEPGFRLGVIAQGYAPYISEFMPSGTQGVEFVLVEGAVVSGRIVDADSGAPLPSTAISMHSEYSFETRTIHSDADGYFFVSAVRPGVYVAALRDDELVLTPESAAITVSESGAEVELKAAQGGSVSGRVTQTETGEGIGGALLTLIRATNRSDVVRTQTDPTGAYRFQAVKPGAYTVTLQYVSGFAPEVAGDDANSRRVSVQLRDAVSGVDFIQARGLRISGRVVDDTGRPVRRIGVNAYGNNRGLTSYAFTDDSGAFMVAGFEPDSDVRFDLQRDGYALLESPLTDQYLHLAGADVTGLQFVMGVGATVSGVIVDKQGLPKRHVHIYAEEFSKKLPKGGGGLSGSNGEFTIDGLAPGHYRIKFSNSRAQLPDEETPTVTVARGEKVTGLRAIYPATGEQPISGRVTNARGMPVRDATVELASGGVYGTSTDTNGQFVLENVPEGTHTLKVYSDTRQATQDAKAGESGVVIVLKDLAAVSGQVVDAITNQPVPIFTINSTAIRDPQGLFETDFSEGAQRMRVSADEYATVNVSIPPLQAGEHRKNIVVRLEPAVQLSGRVTDASGKGVVGASVSAMPVPGGAGANTFPSARATTLADGHFTIGPLPARAVKVTAARKGYQQKAVNMVLAHGGANRADIVLSEGAAIEGMVTVNGKPVPRATIQVNSKTNDSDAEEARTDAQGRYRVSGLNDGTYEITARLQVGTPASGRSKSVNATITGNARATANIAFRIDAGIVSGRVYRSHTESAGAGVRLNLATELADGTVETHNTRTDAQGEYAFTGVSAGIQKLHLYVDETSRRVRFTLAANEQVQKDFHLDAGRRIRVELSGAAATRAREAVVMLFDGEGEVVIPELSEAAIEQFNDRIVATNEINNGVAELGPVEPGTYTVFAAVGDFSAGPNPDGTIPGEWTTQVIQIDEKVTDTLVIRLNF